MQSVTIAFVRAGSHLPAQLIDHLIDMLGRCLPADVPVCFTCFTDQPETHPLVRNQPLPEGVHGWWAKLAMFRPEAFEPGTRVLYFDLDTLFVGLLDDIMAYRGDFAILRDVYRPDGMQSSVMAWEAGKFNHIWNRWIDGGCPEVEGGDQIWIEHAIGMQPDRLQDLFPGQFASYKVDCLQGPPAEARVVFFHGPMKPWEAEGGWVHDFWKIGGLCPMDLDLVCNTSAEQLEANVRGAMARGLPELPPHANFPHEETLCVVGGGPSLKADLGEIALRQRSGQKIWALNGAGNFLIANRIVPDAILLMDARPENAAFVERPHTGVHYYIASQCHPDVFDALADRQVTVWHTDRCADWLPPTALLNNCGATVGLKALWIALHLGFRWAHLFGFDSSYAEDDHHAFAQALNDGEATYVATVGTGELRSFKAAAWMIQQMADFQRIIPDLAAYDFKVTVHGDGLLPHVARIAGQPEGAHDARARAVLRRLPQGPVKGAEIGVFVGAMSRAMLKNPGIELLMVDPWEQGDGLYEDEGGLSDFHAEMSQTDQDTAYAQAKWNTHFASGRGVILRKRSLDAARDVADGSLDFVFIDANHSYAACRADIEAWRPKLKSGGLLAGHDYEHPDFPEWGVKRAVDEYAAGLGLPVETDENFTWFIQLPAPSQTGDLPRVQH